MFYFAVRTQISHPHNTTGKIRSGLYSDLEVVRQETGGHVIMDSKLTNSVTFEHTCNFFLKITSSCVSHYQKQ